MLFRICRTGRVCSEERQFSLVHKMCTKTSYICNPLIFTKMRKEMYNVISSARNGVLLETCGNSQLITRK